VTALVIPGHNDSDEEVGQTAHFLKDIDPDIPWQLSAFYPAHRMMEIEPTDREALLRAWQIAKDVGLHHVYCGNIPAMHEDTVCPHCDKTLIRRVGSYPAFNRLDHGRCPYCQTPIHGVWNGASSTTATLH
jgi:pyruvate formate lyase activating enzyme